MPNAPVFFGDMESSLKAVMVFPDHHERARVFAAWLTLRKIAILREKGLGHELDAARQEALLEIAIAGSEFAYIFDDACRNLRDGTFAGIVVACLFALVRSDQKSASWEMAIKCAEQYIARFNVDRRRGKENRKDVPASRKLFRDCLPRFGPVLHLLGARTLRRRDNSADGIDRIIDLKSDPVSDYLPTTDVLFFAQEARHLQVALMIWNSRRRHGSELLAGTFDLIDCWEPPTRQHGWPDTGQIKAVTIDPWIDIVRGRSGRPKTLSQNFGTPY